MVLINRIGAPLAIASVLCSAASAQSGSLPSEDYAPIAPGRFKGNLDSLKAAKFPKWFTDGKLGIWAHWGPQAVPMVGDWYARQLYEQGSRANKEQIARFGHPSKVGYKDVIPHWKAEKWDPDALMKLYKAAGAKYFVSMAVHHDNFDLWNSTTHRWNAVKMGPKRDVVGDWQKAAKKQGLKFGVSEHLGASWTWFQVSRGSDKAGPLAGVPYDGNDPAYEDLYHPAALPNDKGWYSTDPRWHKEWFRRIKDLVDGYRPDLLYTDGALPFGDVGASIVAHLYNLNSQSVYACKQPGDGRWAQDVERGVLSTISPYPWQIDTSIGDWYYNKGWKYRGAEWVIQTLVDVVSKNGNLLINVVQRPDGSLDPEAEQILQEMAAWMKVNGESIYGTRPWLVYGEGPTRAKGGAFKEDFGFSAKDVRFAQKGESLLYATIMGIPDSNEITLKALAKHEGDQGTVTTVSLLGSRGKVTWRQDDLGLHLTLPKGQLSKLGSVLRIRGSHLRSFNSVPDPSSFVKPPQAVIKEDSAGTCRLTADKADMTEGSVRVEEKGGRPNIGYWDNPNESVWWQVEFSQAGTYGVIIEASAEAKGAAVILEAAGSSCRALVAPTGAWDKFVTVSAGRITISAPGKTKVVLRPADTGAWSALNVREVLLKRVSAAASRKERT